PSAIEVEVTLGTTRASCARAVAVVNMKPMARNSWTLIVFSPNCLQALHFESVSVVQSEPGGVLRMRQHRHWSTEGPWPRSPSRLHNRPLRPTEDRHETWRSNTPDGELRRRCSAADHSGPERPVFSPFPAELHQPHSPSARDRAPPP